MEINVSFSFTKGDKIIIIFKSSIWDDDDVDDEDDDVDDNTIKFCHR